jgi:hypothetical protein
VALPDVKSPGDLCILLTDGMDDFTVRPTVDLDVIQILETMQFYRPLPIPQISPGDNVERGIASIDPFEAILSNESPCPDNYPDAPNGQIRCVAILDHDAVDPPRLR